MEVVAYFDRDNRDYVTRWELTNDGDHVHGSDFDTPVLFDETRESRKHHVYGFDSFTDLVSTLSGVPLENLWSGSCWSETTCALYWAVQTKRRIANALYN